MVVDLGDRTVGLGLPRLGSPDSGGSAGSLLPGLPGLPLGLGRAATAFDKPVSLDTLSFQRSADVVVMLILGGAGRLYGGIIGAIIFLLARDQLSDMNPQYWYFWIGLLLMFVVLVMPNGILGGLARLVGKRD